MIFISHWSLNFCWIYHFRINSTFWMLWYILINVLFSDDIITYSILIIYYHFYHSYLISLSLISISMFNILIYYNLYYILMIKSYLLIIIIIIINHYLDSKNQLSIIINYFIKNHIINNKIYKILIIYNNW